MATVGPPAQATFTVSDASGLASILVTQSSNADTIVPPFSAGSPAPVVVTATKIDQSQSSTVTIVATDAGGLVRTCTATFLPLAVAARVRGVSATATARGVRVHWRTASEVGVVGFNVYRSAAGRRSRVNAHLLAARAGSGGRAYSYLVRDGVRTARYWVPDGRRGRDAHVVRAGTGRAFIRLGGVDAVIRTNAAVPGAVPGRLDRGLCKNRHG